jgi:hypothetical protein
MLLFYAAPFVLLSFIAYGVCLSIPRLRPHALKALVAPVAFGVCSVIALAALALALDKVWPSGNAGAVVGMLAYLLFGTVGAWLAMRTAGMLERRYLPTPDAHRVVFRLVMSLVAFGIVSFICFAIGVGLVLPIAESTGLLLLIAGASFVIGVFAAGLTYRLMRRWQQRSAPA